MQWYASFTSTRVSRGKNQSVVMKNQRNKLRITRTFTYAPPARCNFFQQNNQTARDC